jgi:hypothetical protein
MGVTVCRTWVVLTLAAMAWGGVALSSDLPVTPYPVKIDGDPREALLLGGAAFPVFDAVTGARDGSVRCYALATPEGLYVAQLSTEPGKGENLLSVPSDSPAELVLSDWMAVRLRGQRDLLFFLTPDNRFASTESDGATPGLNDLSWVARGSRFGHTWAGEWLLPWASLGMKAGEGFRLEVLRGRKLVAGRSALELVSGTSPGSSASRWGGAGLPFSVPMDFGTKLAAPRALSPFDVRACVPPEPARAACEDAVPAGEVATAWIELPPSAELSRVSVKGPLAAAEVFLVDFWWQAGTREEQDARIPARVAAGMGDLLVAERLLSLNAGIVTGSAIPPSPWPTRIYLRCRVPREAAPGSLNSQILVAPGARLSGAESPPWTVTWAVTVAPPLPPTRRVVGMYYLEKDPARWNADLADMAAHGFNAATCYAQGETAWRAFVAAGKTEAIDGRFAMDSSNIEAVTGAWAYTVDEPATEAALGLARERAAALRSRGFKAWTALCWPNSLVLARDLDGCALSPGLVSPAAERGLSRDRWTYIQGLREAPAYNRLMAGVFSHAGGMSGLWVFCYASGDEGETDWTHAFIRHDACVENGPGGARIPTVHWEALREGILDSRLREALGEGVRDLDARFPELRPVLEGEYWRLPTDDWDFETYRKALCHQWATTAGRP